MTVAVTFDAGQTLLALDTRMLAGRLAERGVEVEPAALEQAEPPAWQAYERAVAHPEQAPTISWQVFMRALLRGAAPAQGEARVAELAAWLFEQQPAKNLWRRPMPGMIELVDELRAAGVPLAVVSNSEGRLAALFTEIGIADRFVAIADSGVLAIEKPDPRIFDWVAARLGVEPAAIIHVGDSWAADVVGARNVGARAIWFGPTTKATGDAMIAAAGDATGVRAALAAWRVLPR